MDHPVIWTSIGAFLFSFHNLACLSLSLSFISSIILYPSSIYLFDALILTLLHTTKQSQQSQLHSLTFSETYWLMCTQRLVNMCSFHCECVTYSSKLNVNVSSPMYQFLFPLCLWLFVSLPASYFLPRFFINDKDISEGNTNILVSLNLLLNYNCNTVI